MPNFSIMKDQKTEITHQKFLKTSQNVEDIYQRCRIKNFSPAIRSKMKLCLVAGFDKLIFR